MDITQSIQSPLRCLSQWEQGHKDALAIFKGNHGDPRSEYDLENISKYLIGIYAIRNHYGISTYVIMTTRTNYIVYRNIVHVESPLSGLSVVNVSSIVRDLPVQNYISYREMISNANDLKLEFQDKISEVLFT